jgi:tetratricopeptide (TPR) repeat protein/serine/threonine protein kinase
MSVQMRLEDVCKRFESAWQAAGSSRTPPRIEDYFGDAAGREREALLLELMRLDVHYRLQRGERADAVDYAPRFPTEDALVREALAAMLPAVPESTHNNTVFLGLAPATMTDPNRTEPAPSSAAAVEGPGGVVIPGYEFLGELGKGGMGEVLRCHDLHLDRHLAVKVLRDKYRDEPHLVRRFLAEARVHARLQHPGIVPLHDLGELPDRRPYFTMKLVEGRTLVDLLKERTDPTQELPRYLTVFEQVCQTLAYAHSKGVIHRDLKPANIMVGAFGEVQVMDWGLAKVLHRGRPAGASEVNLASSGDVGSETQPGAVLGTYAYMAPEQARGEVESLDERCDVFGLGGILFEVLTSRPPLTGEDRDELAARAQAGDHMEAFAALDASGADAELVRLAKQCLATEPSERPADAGAVAVAMTAYLAEVQERLRRAELDRTAAEARAKEAKATATAERKSRQRTRLLAAMVLVVVAVAAVGSVLLQNQMSKRREDQARHDRKQQELVESALDKTAALRAQMRFREAAAMLEQGRKELGDGGPDQLRQCLGEAEAELSLVKRLDTIRQHLATWVEGHFDQQTAAHDYAIAFEDTGLGKVGDNEEAVAARVRASAVASEIVAALDNWAFVAQDPKSRDWALGVARRAAPDPWGDRFREPALWRDRKALQDLADEALRDDGAMLSKLSPQALELLGALLYRNGGTLEPLLRAAQRRYPNDFWLSLMLGNVLENAKRFAEAAGYHGVAVALRPDAAAAHTNLGNVLRDLKDLDGAIAECRKAIDLDPKLAGAHNNLGNALSNKHHLDEAIAEYRKAIDLDPKLAYAHNNLGLALKDKGDLEGATRCYGVALQINPRYTVALCNLGTVRREKKDLEGAIRHYQAAIAIDPQLGYAHRCLASALLDRGNLEGATRSYLTAIELDSNDILAQVGLGNLLAKKKDLDGAILWYRAAIKLDPKCALAHYNLGTTLKDRKDLDGAIRCWRTAIELDPACALAHLNLGAALDAKGDLEAAIRYYRKAIEIDPKLAAAHVNLGLALKDKGNLDAAIRCYHTAIEVDPKHAPGHSSLGSALWAKGDLQAAVRSYRVAIEVDPNYGVAHYNLGRALRVTGDLAGAIRCFRTAIEVDPASALAHYDLGDALLATEDLEGAIRSFRAAIELDPNLAKAHGSLGQVLQEQGHFAEAGIATRRCLGLLAESDPLRQLASSQLQRCERLAALEKKLQVIQMGTAEPASAAEGVAMGHICKKYKKRHAAAARFYAEAFAAEPRLAADLRQQHRYSAACSAALASCGRGEDAKELPEKVRLMLRRQALAWLRDDLAAYAKLAERPDAAARQFVRQQLAHWQQDTDLASGRDKAALDKLAVDERQQWRQLWDESTALLKKLDEKK